MAERYGEVTKISLFVTTMAVWLKNRSRGANEVYSLQIVPLDGIAAVTGTAPPHVSAPIISPCQVDSFCLRDGKK